MTVLVASVSTEHMQTFLGILYLWVLRGKSSLSLCLFLPRPAACLLLPFGTPGPQCNTRPTQVSAPTGVRLSYGHRLGVDFPLPPVPSFQQGCLWAMGLPP